MNRNGLIRVLLFTLVSFVGASLIACKVPVFRYALERWPSDTYRMVAIIDEKPGIEVANALAAMVKLEHSAANVETETINLSKLSETELWQVEGIDDTAEVPLLQVFYPLRDGQRKLCWSGKLTQENVLAWSDSPTRQKIAKELQSGVSAVWVFVPGNDQSENARIESELAAALAQAEKEITIPDGVITRSDAASYMQENPGASMDDVLRSDIPLRIDFAIQTITPSDDWAMTAMIDHWHQADGQEVLSPPFLFPVFGRGRMIEPLSAERFTKSNVIGACKYLVGECSCTVKAQNPGMDLLLSTSWQETLGDQIVMVSSPQSTEPTTVPIPDGEAGTFEPQIVVQPQLNRRNAVVVTLFALITGLAITIRYGLLNRKKRKANR